MLWEEDRLLLKKYYYNIIFFRKDARLLHTLAFDQGVFSILKRRILTLVHYLVFCVNLTLQLMNVGEDVRVNKSLSYVYDF